MMIIIIIISDTFCIAGGYCEILKVYVHEEYIEHHRHSKLVGLGGMLPQTILQHFNK